VRYLILGSSGQIGSALCEYYGEKNVDRFDITDSDLQDLRLNDNKLLLEKMQSCDFVYFLAFDVGGSRYLQKHQQTFEFVDNNVRLMQNTFDALRVTKKPFVFASSQMSNMDYSSYGALKRVGEWYTKTLGGVVVKLWNVYGIEHDLEKSHVITDFILKAKDTGVIDMLTNGLEERQFLYSEDCCEAFECICANYGSLDRGRELHVSSYKWSTVLEVAEEVITNFPAKIEISNKKDGVQQNKKNEADPYILDFWKPRTPLRDGIKILCDHYNNIEKSSSYRAEE